MTDLMEPTFSDGLRDLLVKHVEASPGRRRSARWRWGAASLIVVALLGGGAAVAVQLDVLPGGQVHSDLATPLTVTRTGTATIQLGTKPRDARQLHLSFTAIDAGTFGLGRGGSTVTVSSADVAAVAASGADRTTAYLELSQLDPGAASLTITTSSPALRWTATLRWVSAETTAWATNARGQTYGVQNDLGSPDLIAVTATNGSDGYVYSKELDELDGTTAAKTFTSPQQALDWQKTHHGGDIPVYESDGTTRIGVFHVGQ